MGCRGRREGGSGWGTHVNPRLIHVNVWQKPLQYCKVISLQLIKINEKKKKNNHWQFKCSPLIPVSPKGRGQRVGNKDFTYKLSTNKDNSVLKFNLQLPTVQYTKIIPPTTKLLVKFYYNKNSYQRKRSKPQLSTNSVFSILISVFLNFFFPFLLPKGAF